LTALIRKFQRVDKVAFVLLYKALVWSDLEYANTVLSPSPYKQYLIEVVEEVQKRATKLVHECKHLPYTDRLKYLKLPTLKYRQHRGDTETTSYKKMYSSMILENIFY